MRRGKGREEFDKADQVERGGREGPGRKRILNMETVCNGLGNERHTGGAGL